MVIIKNLCFVVLVGVFLIFASLIVIFTSYGVYQRLTLDDRNQQEQEYINTIDNLTQKVNSLELDIETCNSCVRWELLLFDILSPQEKQELDAIEESLRQKIQRAFKGKSCSIMKLKKTE